MDGISELLEVDREVASSVVSLLKEQGIINEKLHVYCDECSSENVIECDGFYDIQDIRCHECSKQIDLAEANEHGIRRYSIDKASLEEFVRDNYYDIYESCKLERKIIEIDPKLQVVDQSKEVIKEQDIPDKSVNERLSALERKYNNDDFNKSIFKMILWIVVIAVLTVGIVIFLIDVLYFKDKDNFIFRTLMKAIKGSVLEPYTSEILGGVIAVIGAIYTVAAGRIKFHWDDIKNKFGVNKFL